MPDERRLLIATFAVMAAATCLPIWMIEFHPLPDLAAHLAAVSIWHHHDDPLWDFARYYDVRLGANPYWAYYGALHLLAYPLGVEAANRVLLSLYVVALPVGTALLAKRFGRSPWLGLFAFPLVWNFNFAIGFIPFCFGLAALPFALALFDAYCERANLGLGLAAAAAGAALHFFHLLPWGMYLAAAGLLALLHEGRSLRRLAGRALVWAAAAATGMAVILGGRGMRMGSLSGGVRGAYTPLRVALAGFPDWLWNNCTGHEDELLALGLFAVWLWLKLTARRERRRLVDLRAEACFLAAMAAYLFLPRSIVMPSYWWGISTRFASMAVMFAALCIPGPIVGRRRLLLVPVALLGLGFTVDVAVHWVRAGRFCAGFDELASRPEPGTRVLFIIHPPWRDPSFRHNYAQIYSGFYQVRRGGYLPWNFDEGFPFRYRQRFPAPAWRTMQFNWEQHARYYDYVMLFQAGSSQPFPGHENEVVKIAESGRWSLWKLPGPRVDQPPGPAYPSDWALDPHSPALFRGHNSPVRLLRVRAPEHRPCVSNFSSSICTR